MKTLTENKSSKTTVWSVDAVHSKIQFAVKHLVISEATGHFSDYTLAMKTTDTDFTKGEVELNVMAKSINTGAADRDKHLIAPDFFDAEKFPVIHFKGNSFKKITEEDYTLSGDITIKDTTKPIQFDINYGGQVVDPWGNLRMGFKVKGEINRFDFGLNWNVLMEGGGAMLGKTVKLHADIELVQSK